MWRKEMRELNGIFFSFSLAVVLFKQLRHPLKQEQKLKCFFSNVWLQNSFFRRMLTLIVGSFPQIQDSRKYCSLENWSLIFVKNCACFNCKGTNLLTSVTNGLFEEAWYDIILVIANFLNKNSFLLNFYSLEFQESFSCVVLHSLLIRCDVKPL